VALHLVNSLDQLINPLYLQPVTDTPSPSRDALLASIRALEPSTLGHVLTRSARLLNHRVVTAVHAQGFTEVRESWLGMLRHMDPDGVRSTVLAERLQVSKQAAGQLVSELERKGYLERIPDPSDGRAKLVRITQRGLDAWLAGLEAFRALERDLADAIGPDALAALRLHGADLLSFLETDAAPQP